MLISTILKSSSSSFLFALFINNIIRERGEGCVRRNGNRLYTKIIRMFIVSRSAGI